MSAHLDAETLAAFAEGRLDRTDIPAVVLHIDQCRDCTSAIEAAHAMSKPRTSQMRWWIAAAVLAVIAAGIQFFRSSEPSGMRRLVVLAPRSARTVEARLAGGFAWAPYRGPLRAEALSSRERMKLGGVAAELSDTADREQTAAAQHAAGVALLLFEEPLDGIARLRAATLRAPSDAGAWSDLAAGLDFAAVHDRRPALLPEALDATDRALRIDSSLAEALFNRALILEHLGLTREAQQGWERYLRVDPSSRWAAEARDRLHGLPETTTELQFGRERERLDRAALAGDAGAVRAIVDAFREQTRTWAEAEYLGLWGEALQRGSTGDADRFLAVARAVGQALVALSGESLLHDEVVAIDTAPSRIALARAHADYRQARLRYARRDVAAAEIALDRAAVQFAAVGSPMALVARYYAANARYDRDPAALPRGEVDALQQAVDAHPQYLALAADVRWLATVLRLADADWPEAAASAGEAESRYRRLAEWDRLAFLQMLRGSALIALGRSDEGWAARIAAFRILSTNDRHHHLALSLGDAVRFEVFAGHFGAARALLQLEEAANRESGNTVALANTLARGSIVETHLGDSLAAAGLARDAQATASAIADPSLRTLALAHADVASATAALRTDPGRARMLLSRAVAAFQSMDKALEIPECELLRARAALQLGQQEEARRDLHSALDIVETHRIHFAGSLVGTYVLDVSGEIVRDLIRLELAQRNLPAAFAAIERSRTQIGTARVSSLTGLQRDLAGTGAALLEVTSLGDEIVTICVTENDTLAAREPATEGQLIALGDRAAEGDAHAAHELFDLLIRPSQRLLAGAGRLLVVADLPLQVIPWGALSDGTRYLIESMPVAMALSAPTRPSAPPSAPRTLLPIAAIPADAPALPESLAEVASIVQLYPRSISSRGTTLRAVMDAAALADVLHVTGHTQRTAGTDEATIDLGNERLSFEAVAGGAGTRAPEVVVLAACETLRSPRRARAPFSLGAGFIAAGTSNVFGTLVPIADRDASELFCNLHRNLAAGMAASPALQRTQLDFLATERRTHRRGAWRAVALLTGKL